MGGAGAGLADYFNRRRLSAMDVFEPRAARSDAGMGPIGGAPPSLIDVA